MSRRRCWPQAEDIERMRKEGGHIVPKPMVPGDDWSWRFSFSRQERSLAKLVPMQARYAYMALKSLFKKHWKPKCHFVKSYHLKTWFLWFLESKNEDFWKQQKTENENDFDQVYSFLKYIHEELGKTSCHHYFMADIDLLDQILKTRPEAIKEIIFLRRELNQLLSPRTKIRKA